MKKILSLLCMACCLQLVQAQDIPVLLKEAQNLDRQQKDNEALDKYKNILLQDPVNLKALVRAAEINVLMGGKQSDKNGKRMYYETALSYAQRAWQADSSQPDAAYAMAMTAGRMTDIETENKKIVAYVRDIYQYASKALSLDANHAKANYTMGKWHYEMVTLSGFKKAAVKIFYGGLPASELPQAITYLEKARSLDPYFVVAYLDLAKAYKENREPAKAIEVLTRMVKLPTRTSEDPALKAEGAKLLETLQ
ncbi:MAG: tetratricopeptide repeat protein [Chitinophagaceae bacterium]|nr:tetratricopeptide repeat protein [Chitinophagaceae bacterium]